MTVGKTIAARISAYWNGWDEQEMMACADQGCMFLKEYDTTPSLKVCFYVIGSDDEQYPVTQLMDVEKTPCLVIVLPSDAINLRTLLMLWLLESGRTESEAGTQRQGKLLDITYAIEIVGELGTGEPSPKYALGTFVSVDELVGRMKAALKQMYRSEETLTPDIGEFSIAGSNIVRVIADVLKPIHFTFQIIDNALVMTRETHR